MPFFQMKKIRLSAELLVIVLTIFMAAGCVTHKKTSVKTAEQVSEGKVRHETKALPESQETRYISSVSFDHKDGNFKVRIRGNRKLVYTSIKQSFPFGIAVYFPETGLLEPIKPLIPDNDTISDIQVNYADKEKTTARVEILLKKDLDYKVVQEDTGLLVSLAGSASEPDAVSASGQNPAVPSAGRVKQKSSLDESEAGNTDAIFGKTATMTDIRFNVARGGQSDIVIQTDHPVRYDVAPKGKNKIYLNLYNTIIPKYRRRPFLTRYFKSAVYRIMPEQAPGKDKNARIEIEIRDQVPYRIVQNNNRISMIFEPSSIEPPVFAKAEKKIVSGSETSGPVVIKGPDSHAVAQGRPPESLKETMAEEILGAPRKYTGEKIKLDFYETDIKNVFRILRSVGGLNFAIDKNVKGKVTLSLQDPVPWDQVLDLVLKMNDLGMKKEGNVIRIATLETIKKEEKLAQEAIAARKKSIEQKKSLEPLVTEYIPINYSDAEKDIKPHISQILTKNRGKISVDKRTNMVIITDTRAKIKQARELIYRLDQVTPQIMIEAKVVEVTKDFSRELGLGLSLTKTQTAHSGRDKDFSIALNSPITSPVNSGSFNFYRILGSNFLNLNAQIAASETKGDVKVVSSPRILTLDNKKARIKQGLEYAYLERDDTGGSSVKFKNIDLLLEVTPHVTPDKRISMTVYLTKNDIDSVTNGVPSLSTNEAQTELLVNNNDTIVIGGIVKTTDNKSSSGTPILSGIPIIGRLFRTDINKDKRNELLIFITPSIVQLAQKRNITEEEPGPEESVKN